MDGCIGRARYEVYQLYTRVYMPHGRNGRRHARSDISITPRRQRDTPLAGPFLILAPRNLTPERPTQRKLTKSNHPSIPFSMQQLLHLSGSDTCTFKGSFSCKWVKKSIFFFHRYSIAYAFRNTHVKFQAGLRKIVEVMNFFVTSYSTSGF